MSALDTPLGKIGCLTELILKSLYKRSDGMCALFLIKFIYPYLSSLHIFRHCKGNGAKEMEGALAIGSFLESGAHAKGRGMARVQD